MGTLIHWEPVLYTYTGLGHQRFSHVCYQLSLAILLRTLSATMRTQSHVNTDGE